MNFELDLAERVKMQEWNMRHLQEAHGGKEPYSGATGGRVSYVVTYTSLGSIVSVYCGLCQPSEDSDKRKRYSECLTDFSDW